MELPAKTSPPHAGTSCHPPLYLFQMLNAFPTLNHILACSIITRLLHQSRVSERFTDVLETVLILERN
jgi:hypothetical protein